jgi:signal peptidase I
LLNQAGGRYNDEALYKPSEAAQSNGRMNILKKIGLFFLDIIETGTIALSVFIIVYLFILQPHEVKGNSMLPNFEHAQLLLTDKISYRLSEPERGDVIVFKAPVNARYDYIKRIIGLPGETLTVKDGHVFVDEEQLDETYLPTDTYIRAGQFAKEGLPVIIPQEAYFVMGDNRNYSSDSRDWGTVPRENIVGRVWMRYWPPDKIGKIKQPTY